MDPDSARGRHHLPRIMGAVTDHQPPAVLVNLVTVGIDERGDLSLQSRGKHLPRPVTDNLIKQRNLDPVRPDMIGLVVLLDYLEHGRTFPTSASTPAMIRLTGLQIIPGKVRSFTSPHRGPIHRF